MQDAEGWPVLAFGHIDASPQQVIDRLSGVHQFHQSEISEVVIWRGLSRPIETGISGIAAPGHLLRLPQQIEYFRPIIGAAGNFEDGLVLGHGGVGVARSQTDPGDFFSGLQGCGGVGCSVKCLLVVGDGIGGVKDGGKAITGSQISHVPQAGLSLGIGLKCNNSICCVTGGGVCAPQPVADLRM